MLNEGVYSMILPYKNQNICTRHEIIVAKANNVTVNSYYYVD